MVSNMLRALERDLGYVEILLGALVLTLAIGGPIGFVSDRCSTDVSLSYGGQSTLLTNGSVEINTTAPELGNRKAEVFVRIEDSDTDRYYMDQWYKAGGTVLSSTGSPDLSRNVTVDAEKIPFAVSTGDTVRLIYVGESHQVPAYCDEFIRRPLYVDEITE